MESSKKQPTKTSNGLADIEPEIVFGYDRITMWSDHNSFPGGLDVLRGHCKKFEEFPGLMPFNPQFKSKIQIRQPTKKCLRILAAALGSNISVRVNYVEFSCDIPAESKKQALHWRNKFLASARMKNQRQSVVRDDEYKSNYYYGRRANEDRSKRRSVLAVYADKPSKVQNARPTDDTPPCLHLEFRVASSTRLASLGIVTIEDMINFNHKSFWNENIAMYELPKPTKLGRLLARVAGADLNVSGSALRRRAMRFKEANENNHIGNKFIMHNALLRRPDISRRLKAAPFYQWTKAMLR